MFYGMLSPMRGLPFAARVRTMTRWSGRVLIGVAMLVWTTGYSYAASQESQHTETVQQHCVRCHNDRAMTGNLSLEGADPKGDVTQFPGLKDPPTAEALRQVMAAAHP